MAKALCNICLGSFREEELYDQNGQKACESCHTQVEMKTSRMAAAVLAAPETTGAVPAQTPTADTQANTQLNNFDSIYYKHSGRVDPVGLIQTLVAGGVVTGILSWLYGWLTAYILYFPYTPVILNAAMTVFLAAGIGFTLGFLAKQGKMRNTPIVTMIGLMFACIAVFIMWKQWLLVVAPEEALQMDLDSFSGMSSAVGALAEKGVWVMWGWQPTGGTLKFIWIVEAACVILGSVGLAYAGVADTPFCEDCNQWTAKSSVSAFKPIQNVGVLRSRLEAGDVGALQELEKMRRVGVQDFMQLDLHRCAECNNLFFLAIIYVSCSVGDDNKEEKSESILIENLRINKEVYDWIKQL